MLCVLQADLVARDSHIREMGSETEKKEAEMLRQTGELRSLKRKQRAPEYQVGQEQNAVVLYVGDCETQPQIIVL